MSLSTYDKDTTYATIDLDAVAHNVRQLTAHIGPETEMFAVVKANGYGHGAVQVARTALQNGASRLAVGRVVEGVELRQAQIHAPILVLGYFVLAEIESALTHDLTVTINSLEVAQALSDQAQASNRTVKVHIKIDTGMGRYGLLPEEAVPFVEQLSRLPGIELEGVFTHFATADMSDKTYARQQFSIFKDVLDTLGKEGYTFPVRHAANSAATLDLPETHLDAVRPGIALYGLYPSDEVSTELALKPALSLKSHVARVRTLPAGSSISYGRTYITTKPIRAALVPVGYGDGYHRMLSNKGQVLIHGQRAPIVGRVCMDQFVVDVTNIDGVTLNDEVVLLGCQQNECITAEELASLADTINYEIATSLLPRVPRIYLGG